MSTVAKVDISTSRSMSAGTLTVGDYRKLYEGLDDDVIVDTTSHTGDRPWESGYTSVTVNTSNKLKTTNDFPGMKETDR